MDPDKLDGIGNSGIDRDISGKFLPGHVGIGGHPKGKTIKELVREYLEENEGARQDFVQHFIKKNRELAWQMLEGRPPQDVTSGGEALKTISVTGADRTFMILSIHGRHI